MDFSSKSRFQGYVSTPPLWESGDVSPFEQIQLANNFTEDVAAVVFKNHRLGKLVEEFVFHQLKNRQSVTWICDNLQIQEGKRTVGEIDALYYENHVPVHLEIAYKFYLYDTAENHEEPLAHWIGPNRKDNLFLKLSKLHARQFPLLQNKLAEPYLNDYNLEIGTIKQKLCFKGQLFLPFQEMTTEVGPLNANCVAGCYIYFNEIKLFREYYFFIPKKIDWLVIPHHEVTWLNYAEALKLIEADLAVKRSPLVWIKRGNGIIQKCFIVFW